MNPINNSRVYCPWLENGEGFELVGDGVEPALYEDIVSITHSLEMRMPSMDELMCLFFEYYPPENRALPNLEDLFACYPIFTREVAHRQNGKIEIYNNSCIEGRPNNILDFDEGYFGRTTKKNGLKNPLLSLLLKEETINRINHRLFVDGEHALRYGGGKGYGYLEGTEGGVEDSYIVGITLGFDSLADGRFGYTFAVFDK